MDVTRYTQDGVAYVCAGTPTTEETDAKNAAMAKIASDESLVDMERIDGVCTWTVRPSFLGRWEIIQS